VKGGARGLGPEPVLVLDASTEIPAGNEQITQLNQQQRTVEDEIRTVGAQLTQQEEPGLEEYERKRKRHRLMVASVKLLFIVPVSLIAAWLAMKFKKTLYVPNTCPACGERLYDACGKCNSIRHSLLPYCESCGQEESILEQTLATS